MTEIKQDTSTEENGTINPAFVPDLGDLGKKHDTNGSVVENIEQVKQPDLDLEKSPAKERAQWGNSLEFLMSCIAMSVGLGNIWRFPFTAYENGGGAFLIPYIFTLLLIGRPMYYLEMVLGQFSSRGNLQMFRCLGPGFHGIGYGQLFSVIAIATYYCSLMALTLYYFFNSFASQLPWSSCLPEWTKCVNSSDSSDSMNFQNDSSSSSELYFTQTVLHEKTQIADGLGFPDWQLTLYLLMAWAFVFLVAFKGVKSSGKVSYFLALFPYVVMLALLARAVTLEGSVDGILFFIRPKWDKLLDPKVWYSAVTQCFFSLNIGFGSIVMYSSYNDFHHNINRDAFIVSILDTFTSLLAGFTIFGILGNLAHSLDTTIENVVKTGGTGLAFISYPDAISKFEWVPQLFAVLFFFMLFVLGIGSLVALQSCAATIIKDEFPILKDWWIAAGTCIAGFLIGLVYVTPGGQFVLNLVDYFAGTFNIYIMTIAEVISVVWLYGLEEICLDMEFMLQRKVNVYWRITWFIVTPVLLIVILIYSLVIMKPLTYGPFSYPTGALACGWLLLLIGTIQIPLWACWSIYKNRHLGYPDMIKVTFAPKNWGPKDPKKNQEWQDFKAQMKKERADRNESSFQYLINTLLGKNR